jgi:hypothetical protein
MKTSLQISLVLNLALMGALIFIGVDRLKMAVQTTSPADPPMVAAGAVPTKPGVPQSEPAPFRWDQLYSKHYSDYVKNLRAIGCPEPTVRAIVAADVAAAYRALARQMEQKLAAVANGSWSNQLSSASYVQALKKALQKIPDEEAAKIAGLSAVNPTPVTTAVATAPATSLTLPLVLQNVDLSALNLNNDQKQEIASIRQDFLQATGGANPSSIAPADQAGWQNAQTRADTILEGIIGYDAYAQYQLAAYQAMLQNVTPQSQ